MTDYQKHLNKISQDIQPYLGKGKVADYIPELNKISGNQFAMSVLTVNNELFETGLAQQPFSIQSISKVFILTMVLNLIGSKMWTRVGREPSGSHFNSLIQLEHENGIPRNPFINAGALVITDLLCSLFDGPKLHLLNYIRKLCHNPNIEFNDQVAHSEKISGHRNAALASFLKSYHNLENEVDHVLDVYFHACSIEMSCTDLCKSLLFLANKGKQPDTGQVCLTYRNTKKVNSLMMTCGLYNEVGDFAWRVGLPGKSGVGGGIIAVLPGKYIASVWSPELNQNGNSLAGIKALELLTTYTRKSIF